MQAVAVQDYGQTPRLMNVPEPGVTGHDVRVRMHASGVNPQDWKVVSGMYSARVPADFPLITGTDGAGVVDSVGEDVTRFHPGERVFGMFRHMPYGHGTEAEYAVVKDTAPITRTPDGLDDVHAAALPMAGLTALNMLETLEEPAGSTIFIDGATGGIGMFMTQIARILGMKVIATARPEMQAKMRGLGADEVVDHAAATPLAEQVRSVAPDGVDAYVDLVNDKEHVAEIAACVRQHGKVISSISEADPDLLLPMGLEAVPFRMRETAEQLDWLAKLAADGRLEVPVEKVEPLGRAAEVLAESRSGHMHGKAVLEVE